MEGVNTEALIGPSGVAKLFVAKLGQMMLAICCVSEFVENKIEQTMDNYRVDKDKCPCHLELLLYIFENLTCCQLTLLPRINCPILSENLSIGEREAYFLCFSDFENLAKGSS